MTQPERDPRELLATSFPAFLHMCWKELGHPEPSEVQLDIAEYLQYGPKRKVIEAFRGCGKSYITGAFVLWLLYGNPKLNILVVSASKQRADEFSTFCLNLLERASWLKHLKPREGQRSSKIAFDVSGAVKASQFPSVRSAGITGQITGSRADYIIADDVEIPNNSDTDLAREKLAQQITDFENILKPDPSSQIIFLGTPQTEESIYNKLPERGYAVRIWPARFPGSTEKYGNKLAPWIIQKQEADESLVGHSVWPSRFSNENLEMRMLAQGKSNHALQFMLDTSLSDADRYPLRLSDLVIMDLDIDKGPTEVIWTSSPEKVAKLPAVGLHGDRYHEPMILPSEYAPYTGCVMFIDPSGRGKDETAWAIVAMLMGRMFVLDSGGHRGGYDDDLLRKLLERAKKYKVNLIQVEPNFGDGMFARLLASHRKDVYEVSIEDAKWSRMRKEAKIIDTLEPVMNQHRLIVDRSLVERDYRSVEAYPSDERVAYRLFHQMTRLTKEKDSLGHDDRLDALAGAVGYWLEQMGQHQATVAEKRREDILRKELIKHMDFQTDGKYSRTKNTGPRRMLSSGKALRKYIR